MSVVAIIMLGTWVWFSTKINSTNRSNFEIRKILHPLKITGYTVMCQQLVTKLTTCTMETPMIKDISQNEDTSSLVNVNFTL